MFMSSIALSLLLWSQNLPKSSGFPEGPTTTQPSDVIDPELVRQLLGGESTSVDDVDETLRRLNEAADLLIKQRDAGEKTQAAQQDIVAGLDKLIEEARKNRPASRGGAKQKRQRDERPNPQQRSTRKSSGTAAPHPLGDGEVGKGDQAGNADQKKTRRAEKSELTRGWGFLPQRDREEIAQGFDEQFNEKFREEIEQYYRTLAEQARESNETE